MRIVFLKLFEKTIMAGLSWVKTIWAGKQQSLLRSAKRTQSDAWCKMPNGGLILQGNFAPFFTNLIDDWAEIDIASFTFKMKVLRASITLCKTQDKLLKYVQ